MAPVYALGDVRLERVEQVGRSGEHIRLIVADAQGKQQGILWWRGAGWELPAGRFDIAFTASENRFRGKCRLQLEFRDFRLIERVLDDIRPAELEVIDLRAEKSTQERLLRIQQQEVDLQVWAEADHLQQVAGVGRDELRPAAALVIWTVPVSYSVLKMALQLVAPQRVYLFDQKPGLDERTIFLQRLAGLCKFIVNRKDGRVNLKTLAVQMAHSEVATRMGLAWLEARGALQVFDNGAELELSVREPGNQVPTTPELVLSQLNPLLQESAAFRKYYAQTDPENWIRQMS